MHVGQTNRALKKSYESIFNLFAKTQGERAPHMHDAGQRCHIPDLLHGGQEATEPA